MKKIFSFIGSEKKGNSNTYRYTNLILNCVREKYNGSLEVESVVAGFDEISKCVGCQKCFKSGKCELDSNDYMEDIKQRMQEADLIILGCGGYLQQASSEMKNFIDRLAYWTRTPSLSGKQCVLLNTSDSSCDEYVLVYLQKIAYSLGMQVVGMSYCMVEYPIEFSNIELIDEKISKISDVIVKSLKGNHRKGLFSSVSF